MSFIGDVLLWVSVALNIYAGVMNMRWAHKHYLARNACLELRHEMLKKMWGQQTK